MKTNNLVDKTIHATGGGAYKYNDMFEEEFVNKGVQVLKQDEMSSLVNGMSFMTKYANKPSFEVESPSKKGSLAQKSFIEEIKDDFPKLLVSCGSGVSIIKVDDFNSF